MWAEIGEGRRNEVMGGRRGRRGRKGGGRTERQKEGWVGGEGEKSKRDRKRNESSEGPYVLDMRIDRATLGPSLHIDGSPLSLPLPHDHSLSHSTTGAVPAYYKSSRKMASMH